MPSVANDEVKNYLLTNQSLIQDSRRDPLFWWVRKQNEITQVQLAEALDVSQQTINSYEVARRRVPVSALPVLAELFDVSVDELLGAGNKKPAKRGPSSRLQQQLERVSALPRSKQKFVIEMIDTVIQQQAS